MREEVGLAMRQEFQEAVDVVEETIPAQAPAVADPEVLAIADNFEVTKAKIAAMKQACAGLTIAGLEDRKGYDLVHSRRMEVRDARTGVDKIRKALKEGVLARGRKIDSVAKELTSLLVEIEEPLEAEEKRIDAEREKLKAQKQAEAAAKIQARVDAFQKVGAPISLAEITLMTDIAFEFALASATEAWEAKEKLRIAAEEALAKQEAERKAAEEKAALERAQAEKAERERLDKVRAEQDEMARKLAQQKAELDRQAAEIQAKKDAQEREAREEKIRKDAAEKAKAKAEQDAKDATERAERERVEQEAKAKAIEAAKPDADKIRALARVLREIAFPNMATEAGRLTMSEIVSNVARLANNIEGKANTLSPITPKAP
jgi:DNA repair exonuclease SbcCD ATPase subunit